MDNAARIQHETKETGSTARTPIGREIILGLQAGADEAIESVLLWVDDDADVAAPGNQVARLRMATIPAPSFAFSSGVVRISVTDGL